METSTSHPSNPEGESPIELQKLQAQNKAAQIAYREKQLAADIELAKFEVNHRQEMERKQESDKRKMITLLMFAVLTSIAMVVGFLAWCLSIGKEQFVIDLLKYSLYPISAGGGYWAGWISRSQSTSQ